MADETSPPLEEGNVNSHNDHFLGLGCFNRNINEWRLTLKESEVRVLTLMQGDFLLPRDNLELSENL